MRSPLNKADRIEFARYLGRRSYESRLRRLGIEKLQQIARENGKKGGRPPKEKEG